jgi:hypothetical protein
MRFRVQVVAVPVVTMAIVVACGSKAFAQGAYVSASLLGDIVRSTHTEYPGISNSGGGEAIGFALRAGTPLGAIWGVEVELARPAEIENEFEPNVFPLSQTSLSYTFVDLAGGSSSIVSTVPPLRPDFLYSVRTSQRNTTLGVSLWAQQQLSARIAMVYLGGVGFHRTEFESEFSFPPRLAGGISGIPPSLIIAIPPYRTEHVTYGVRPMVGLEARIEMTRHLHLVPGFRLHAGDGLWLMRPAVGVGWTF